MKNYELIPFRIPTNDREAEQNERRLEQVSKAGGELVAFMPTTRSDLILGVFQGAGPGTLTGLKSWD